jgi:hypothetical protein
MCVAARVIFHNKRASLKLHQVLFLKNLKEFDKLSILNGTFSAYF